MDLSLVGNLFSFLVMGSSMTGKEMAKSVLEQNQYANLEATMALDMIGNLKIFDHDFHWDTINHVYKSFMSEDTFHLYRSI